MKGLIEQLWENHNRKRQRYLVLEIAGERYSLWDEALMDNLEEGLVVEYEWKQSGKYRNITSIDPEPAYSASVRAGRKDRDMVRMSCLKSAASLLAPSNAETDQRGTLTLQLAKEFEKYITGDEG